MFYNTMNQWELEENTRNRHQARENAYDQVAIGFGFVFDCGWEGGAITNYRA